MKLLFAPIGIGAGLLAGLFAQKGFEKIWGSLAGDEPPDAKHRRINLAKLAAALLLEGALFRLVKGFVDHGTRRGFARVTGQWPGEEEPEPT